MATNRTSTVDTALKQLAAASKILNEASDKLTSQLALIESALAEYRLGISAWVELGREKESNTDDEGNQFLLTWVEQLGYGKHHGKWGLLVNGWHEGNEPEEPIFLRDAPRETRLRAVEKVPVLLVALAEKANKLAGDTARKAEEAGKLAESMSWETF